MRQPSSLRYLILLFLFFASVNAFKEYPNGRSRQTLQYTVENVMKLRCYQCNQPYDCRVGVCYGDICVKSLVNNHYVSKGCENLTISTSVYDPSLRMRAYCKEEEVLGVDTINCFCRDADYCNASVQSTFFHVFSIVVLLLRL
uniref:Protein quiver n=1 Tax=Caenorhabditis japonica TaxID=281687 RepID=A0A8R1ER86_CAEJA